MELNKVDSTISEIENALNFYSFIVPLNQNEEKESFFKNLRKDRPYNPVFVYKPGNFSKEREILDRTSSYLEFAKVDEDLKYIFSGKIDFIRAQIDLLESDDKGFGDAAVRLHGKPDVRCLKIAEKILLDSKESSYSFPEEVVTPREMASIFSAELENRNIDWECSVSSKIIPKITVSGREKKIYVNSNINYTKDEIERLKVHEIKVHIYRGVNGSNQPFRIFQEGLAGYNETEEGMAIVAEEKCGCLETDQRQLKIYAARALSTDYCSKMDFYSTFMSLRIFLPEPLAYRVTERGKRGMKDTSFQGGMTKGFHYISGREKIKKYIEEGKDLSILYVGKIGIGDIDIVKRLKEKGIIKDPVCLPEFV